MLFATLPILAFVHFGELLQTELMVSKLALLPVGAICLAGAAILSRDGVRCVGGRRYRSHEAI
jgi:hypothetical protein